MNNSFRVSSKDFFFLGNHTIYPIVCMSIECGVSGLQARSTQDKTGRSQWAIWRWSGKIWVSFLAG